MAIRNAIDKNGIIVGTVELPDDAIEQQWNEALAKYNPPVKSLSQIVYDRISQYEKIAPKLLKDIKTSNTLAGITTAQSAQMLTDYLPILAAIKEGMFPTALYLLGQAVPLGFVTQDMINSWIALLQANL